MTFTNPLTQAIEWLQALLWATGIGIAALRTTGYTPTQVWMTLSLGMVGLLLGRYAFPRGPLDLPWFSFPFELPPLPGYLCAVIILVAYRVLEWYQRRQDGPERE